MPVGIYPYEKRKGMFENGHLVSVETRKKQSMARIGKKPSKNAIDKLKIRLITNNPMMVEKNREKISKTLTGHLVSESTRKKISEKLRGTRTGSKNTSWKGGLVSDNLKIRYSVEYRLWRESVFARDNWTCQDCKDNTGRNLNAHHIKPFSEFSELRTSIENGITLCRKCHEKLHKLLIKNSKRNLL